MSRTILALIADLHCGHKLALCPPGITLHDEAADGQLMPYTPQLTASQKYLWTLYQGGITATLNFARGDPVMVVCNGDLTQGSKHPEGLMTTRMSDQIDIGVACLAEWLRRPGVTGLRLAAGTSAHNFGEATADILASTHLQATYPRHSVSVCYHGLMTYNGLAVDYAHHGPHPGSRTWLAGNIARFYLRDLMLREITAGRIPPGLVLRAHYHIPADETVTVGRYTSRIILSPSFTVLGDYAVMRSQSTPEVTNGMIAIEVVDGRVGEVREWTNTIDVRTREQWTPTPSAAR